MVHLHRLMATAAELRHLPLSLFCSLMILQTACDIWYIIWKLGRQTVTNLARCSPFCKCYVCYRLQVRGASCGNMLLNSDQVFKHLTLSEEIWGELQARLPKRFKCSIYFISEMNITDISLTMKHCGCLLLFCVILRACCCFVFSWNAAQMAPSVQLPFIIPLLTISSYSDPEILNMTFFIVWN